ncbi:hypothetical protein IAT38_004619 [Cryptococcus sp. DSM 104549]
MASRNEGSMPGSSRSVPPRRQQTNDTTVTGEDLSDVELGNGPTADTTHTGHPTATFSLNNPPFPERPEETWRIEPTLRHWHNPKRNYTETSITENFVVRPSSYLTRRHPLTLVALGSLIPIAAIGAQSFSWANVYASCNSNAKDWESEATRELKENTELRQRIAQLEASCGSNAGVETRDPVWVGEVGDKEKEEDRLQLWWKPSIDGEEGAAQ